MSNEDFDTRLKKILKIIQDLSEEEVSNLEKDGVVITENLCIAIHKYYINDLLNLFFEKFNISNEDFEEIKRKNNWVLTQEEKDLLIEAWNF